jgi:hypothetical protein
VPSGMRRERRPNDGLLLLARHRRARLRDFVVQNSSFWLLDLSDTT